MNFKAMLATIGLLSITIPTVLSVMACEKGTTVIEPEVKKQLKEKLTNLEANGEKCITAELVLTEVISLNGDSGVTVDDVEVQDFNAADYNNIGSAKIIAKLESDFTGFVDVKITSLPKFLLVDRLINLEVDGSKFNTAESVLTEVISLNSNSGVTVDDVEVQDFIPAGYGASGSVIIKAVASSKFIGSVEIIITEVGPKTRLSNVLKVTDVDGEKANNKSTVLIEVANLNKEFGLTQEGLTIGNFNAATDDTSGNATIIATSNGRFTGSLSIVITPLSKEKILEKIKNWDGIDSNEIYNAWQDYFRRVKADIPNRTFNFTKDELEDANLLKNKILLDLKEIFKNDIETNNIQAGYDPDKINIDYIEFNLDKENNMIVISGSADLDINIGDNFWTLSFDFISVDLHYQVT